MRAGAACACLMLAGDSNARRRPGEPGRSRMSWRQAMAAAVFTSRNVEIGGLRFHYTDWDGDGPPLVMLHGLTGHARTWDDTAAALSDRYHVLALDQRGHGDTDWAPRY